MMSSDEKKILHVTLPGPGDTPKCDFCSDPEPAFCFLADDVSLVMQNEELKNLILNSDPHWGACPKCAVLVRARDKQALHDRCLAEFKRKFGDSGSGVSEMSLTIIQETMFWSVFSGKEHPASAHQKVEI